MNEMTLRFGRNDHNIILPRNVAISLKIEMDYLSALCGKDFAKGNTAEDAETRHTFILGMLSMMATMSIITPDEKTAIVDLVYDILHSAVHPGYDYCTNYEFKEDC